MGTLIAQQLVEYAPHSTPYSTGTLARGLHWFQVEGNHLTVGEPSVFANWLEDAPEHTIAGFIRFMLENKLGYLYRAKKGIGEKKQGERKQRIKRERKRKELKPKTIDELFEELSNAVIDLAFYHPTEEHEPGETHHYSSAERAFEHAREGLARRGISYPHTADLALDYFDRMWPRMREDVDVQKRWGKAPGTLNEHYDEMVHLLKKTAQTNRDISKKLAEEAESYRAWKAERRTYRTEAESRGDAWLKARMIESIASNSHSFFNREGKRVALTEQRMPRVKRPQSDLSRAIHRRIQKIRTEKMQEIDRQFAAEIEGEESK